MANHVGTKLARLIRERSYLSGEVDRLQEAAQLIPYALRITLDNDLATVWDQRSV